MLHHIALSLLRGLTQPQCVDLLRNIDHPRALFEDTAVALDTLDQLVPATRTQLLHLFAERGEEALSRAADELEFCRRHNIRPLALGTNDYPRRLAECPDAPVVVYYRGTADLDARHIVAVVGTRRITPDGKAISFTLMGIELFARVKQILSGDLYYLNNDTDDNSK